MEEQMLMFEKSVKISEDEDLKALNKKLLSDKEIRWFMLELGLRLEAICEKLRDAFIKILIDGLNNKIKQDKDFKALKEKHEVKNEKQFIFEWLLYYNVKKKLLKKYIEMTEGEMAVGDLLNRNFAGIVKKSSTKVRWSNSCNSKSLKKS